jgi:pimeloyl-ACP methyl ester carboxylesterase
MHAGVPGAFVARTWLVAAIALAADVPPGQIVDAVTCAADPTQSYAIFLPHAYTPDRDWPVILAFDTGGRGRTPVERYQAAADQYGFIVAGSNNSRNNSPEIGRAVAAMSADVLSRFRVDERRVYVAGMSGGARVAFSVALGSPDHVAGVIASSAGYPDDKPRKTLPFPVFATAGTEDFNHLELRRLDRALTSPHRLAVFEGGHVWLSSDLAIEAVEWMELQAMKSGRKPRDESEIDRLFTRRVAAAGQPRTDLARYLSLRAIVEDFDGVRDVKALAAESAALARDKSIRAALKKGEDEDDREERMLHEVWKLEGQLASSDDRTALLADLRRRWQSVSDAAKKPEDSSERRLARRVLSGLNANLRSADPDYLKIIAEFRPVRNAR